MTTLASAESSAAPGTSAPTTRRTTCGCTSPGWAPSPSKPVPVIERGEGAYLWDTNGRRYLDALSALFVVQAGYGREEIAAAADRQTRKLAYFPVWSYATPPAIELADRLAALAPGDLNKVFFSSGGGEAVETAWKLAKQYFKLTGKPNKTKVISRAVAYHGTTQGALAITGVPGFQIPFAAAGPRRDQGAEHRLLPGSRAPGRGREGSSGSVGRRTGSRRPSSPRAPDSVAAVFVEPVQNAGGSIPPPPGYFERLREICDAYDVLLVSDEVICAYGRLGTMFGADKFGYQPDIITSAKGLTSGYAALGAAIISDRIFEPFSQGKATFPHGYTFGGHPVGLRRRAGQPRPVREGGPARATCCATRTRSAATLGKLLDLPIVGDVRGDGYFWSVELVKDQASKETFTRDDCERVLRGVVAPACGRPASTAAPTTAARPSSSSPRR